MPNRHRPQPEFPESGFLGVQRLPNGYATELNTTIPHPTEFGRWTNSPLLVPGQIGTDELLMSDLWPTDEQQQRAMDFAAFLQAHDVKLPSYATPEEAAAGAVHR